MEHMSIIEELKPALSLSDEARLTQIEAGEVNQVFQLEDGHNCYAVKSLARDEFSGINRFHQYLLQEQLAHRSIAPSPVWMNQSQNLWVEKWLEKQPAQELAGKDIPVTLGAVIANIHSQPVTVRPLNLPQRLHHYIERAGLAPDHKLVRQTHQIISQYALDYVPAEHLVLCHNDLSWGHVQSVEPMIIVDWEYGAMGNRFFDLASCASINQFDETETARLIEEYARATTISHTTVEHFFAEQQQVVAVTEALWEAALKANHPDQS